MNTTNLPPKLQKNLCLAKKNDKNFETRPHIFQKTPYDISKKYPYLHLSCPILKNTCSRDHYCIAKVRHSYNC